jgi:hypothetical protein
MRARIGGIRALRLTSGPTLVIHRGFRVRGASAEGWCGPGSRPTLFAALRAVASYPSFNLSGTAWFPDAAENFGDNCSLLGIRPLDRHARTGTSKKRTGPCLVGNRAAERPSIQSERVRTCRGGGSNTGAKAAAVWQEPSIGPLGPWYSLLSSQSPPNQQQRRIVGWKARNCAVNRRNRKSMARTRKGDLAEYLSKRNFGKNARAPRRVRGGPA